MLDPQSSSAIPVKSDRRLIMAHRPGGSLPQQREQEPVRVARDAESNETNLSTISAYLLDGFESDTNEIGSGCHLLLYFNPDTNTNADLIGYEYKTDNSNPDTNPDTFSI